MWLTWVRFPPSHMVSWALPVVTQKVEKKNHVLPLSYIWDSTRELSACLASLGLNLWYYVTYPSTPTCDSYLKISILETEDKSLALYVTKPVVQPLAPHHVWSFKHWQRSSNPWILRVCPEIMGPGGGGGVRKERKDIKGWRMKGRWKGKKGKRKTR